MLKERATLNNPEPAREVLGKEVNDTQKVPIDSVFEEALSGALDLVAWLRRVLEILHRDTDDEFLKASLHALVRACDPETNPRLRNIVAVAQPHRS